MSLNISFKIIEYQSNDYKKMIDLRTKILREPLGLQFSESDLSVDAYELLLGGFINNDLVSCAQLKPINKGFKLRQMAVNNAYQKQGIGKKMLIFAEQIALENNAENIELHARLIASGFYEKLGYTVQGDIFTEVSIPHVLMKKKFINSPL